MRQIVILVGEKLLVAARTGQYRCPKALDDECQHRRAVALAELPECPRKYSIECHGVIDAGARYHHTVQRA
jgi:hypothetical protein